MSGKKAAKQKSTTASFRSRISGFHSKQSCTELQEKCRINYQESRKMYKKFFLECIEEIEALQPNGFSCIQAHRYFIVGVLPQHCIIPDPLTKKQRERVERILRD